MRSLHLICMLCFLAFSAEAQRAKRSISIGPARLNFELAPGQSATQKVVVHNKMTKPFSFTTDFSDWTLYTSGRDIFLSPGAEPNSCVKWITIDKTLLDIPAGGFQVVNVTVKVPDTVDLKESRWTMLNIATTAEKRAPTPSEGGIGVSNSKTFTVGVRIYVTPKSTDKATNEIRMRKFYTLPDAPNKNYRIECVNTGSLLLRCNFSMVLSSQETGEKTTVGPIEAVVLPGLIRYVDMRIPDTLAKGKYSAIAMIDANDDEVDLEAAEAELEIK